MATTSKDLTKKVAKVVQIDPALLQKRMEDLTPAEIRQVKQHLAEVEKLKREEVKRQRQEDVAKKELERREASMPPTLLPGEGRHEVSLAQLVHLDQVGIPNGASAMRGITDDNRDKILMEIETAAVENRPVNLPPLRVQPSSRGYIIWDGYHRKAAFEMYLMQVLKEGGHLSGDRATDEALIVDQKQNFMVEVEDSSFSDTFELLDAAYCANFDHGLPASGDFRSKYAEWYFNMMKERGTPVTVRAAERKAKLKHPALLNWWKRQEEKAKGNKEDGRSKKMLDVVVTLPEDQADLADFQRQLAIEEREREDKKSTEDPSTKHIRNLIAAAKFFKSAQWDEIGDMTEAFEPLFRPMLAGKLDRREAVLLCEVANSISEIVHEITGEEGLFQESDYPKGKQGTLITHQ
jgi:hypothetical protein